MIEQQPLDVVVLDVGLPKMSGIELCSALRRQEIDIPILILSARDAVGDRVTGSAGGRRRLSGQTVRTVRTRGTPRGVAAARGDPAGSHHRVASREPASRHRTATSPCGHRALGPHTTGVRSARSLRHQPGRRAVSGAVVGARVGLRLRRRHERGRCVRRLSAPPVPAARPLELFAEQEFAYYVIGVWSSVVLPSSMGSRSPRSCMRSEQQWSPSTSTPTPIPRRSWRSGPISRVVGWR